VVLLAVASCPLPVESTQVETGSPSVSERLSALYHTCRLVSGGPSGALGLTDELGLTDALGEMLLLGLALADGDNEGDTDGEADADGLTLALGLTLDDGDTLGLALALGD
jgi:hypothetical protein